MVVKALRESLAALLAVPVKDSPKLEEKWASRAEVSWERAMADDQNRHPRRMPDHLSEALAVRAGY
jgi:hypothetical protein